MVIKYSWSEFPLVFMAVCPLTFLHTSDLLLNISDKFEVFSTKQRKSLRTLLDIFNSINFEAKQRVILGKISTTALLCSRRTLWKEKDYESSSISLALSRLELSIPGYHKYEEVFKQKSGSRKINNNPITQGEFHIKATGDSNWYV